MIYSKIDSHYCKRSSLGQRQGKPHTIFANESGQQMECGEQEHHSTQQGEQYGGENLLNALEESYGDKVQDKEQESCREIREACYRNSSSGVIGRNEKMYQILWEEHECNN